MFWKIRTFDKNPDVWQKSGPIYSKKSGSRPKSGNPELLGGTAYFVLHRIFLVMSSIIITSTPCEQADQDPPLCCEQTRAKTRSGERRKMYAIYSRNDFLTNYLGKQEKRAESRFYEYWNWFHDLIWTKVNKPAWWANTKYSLSWFARLPWTIFRFALKDFQRFAIFERSLYMICKFNIDFQKRFQYLLWAFS